MWKIFLLNLNDIFNVRMSSRVSFFLKIHNRIQLIRRKKYRIRKKMRKIIWRKRFTSLLVELKLRLRRRQKKIKKQWLRKVLNIILSDFGLDRYAIIKKQAKQAMKRTKFFFFRKSSHAFIKRISQN